MSSVATAMLAGAAYIELRALGNNLNQDVQEKAQEAGKSFSSRFSTAAKLGLATVGGVAAEAFGKALENANTQNILKAQLGLSDADSKRLGSISGELYAKAYGDSLDEINDALKSLMQSGVTNLNQPREEIQGITADALNLSKAFGVDVAESANAAGQMIKTGMAKNGKEAFDILTIAFQKFGQNGDDVLDTLGEYNVQFQRLGIDGPMAMGLINQGLKAGARNTDFIADGIKEFTINATQGSTKIAQGWKDLGLNSDVMFKKIGEGGKTATDAFGETLAKLRDIKDPIKQSAIATELFGTKAEDLGKALFALDPSTAVQSLGKVTGAADTLGNTLRDNSQVEIEEFKRRAEMFMTGKMAELIPFVTGVGSAFASLPAPLQLGVASFGGLVLAAGPVSKVMSGVKSATTGIASVATGAYSGVMNLAAGFNSSEAAASSFTGRMGTIGGAIRSGAGSVGSALSTMGSAALNVASNAGTAALNVAKSTGSMALNAATSAGQFALQMGRMSAAAVTNMATVAWQFTVNAAAATGRFIVSMVETAATTVAQFALMAARAVIWAATMAAQWLIAMGPVGWAIAAVAGLVAIVIANWDTIKNATVAAWNWLWDKIKAVAGFILNLFLTWTIVGIIISHWDEIKTGTANAWNAVASWVSGVPGRIASFFYNWSIVGIVLNNWNSIKDGTVRTVGQMMDFVRGIPGDIVSAFGNAGTLLYNIGQDIVRGIWNGIKSMGSWLKDTLMGWVSDVIPGPIARALGIGSPSKLMRDRIGKWIPAGVIEGVKLGAPALARVMSTLVPTPTLPGIASFAEDWSAPLTAGSRNAALPSLRVPALRDVNSPQNAPPAPRAVGAGGVTVYAQTNADPHAIGREVGWALRTSGR